MDFPNGSCRNEFGELLYCPKGTGRMDGEDPLSTCSSERDSRDSRWTIDMYTTDRKKYKMCLVLLMMNWKKFDTTMWLYDSCVGSRVGNLVGLSNAN